LLRLRVGLGFQHEGWRVWLVLCATNSKNADDLPTRLRAKTLLLSRFIRVRQPVRRFSSEIMKA
jgi:hypothetical protein